MYVCKYKVLNMFESAGVELNKARKAGMKLDFQVRQKQREREEREVAGEQQELNHECA
jgi:ribosomal protein L13E